MLFKTWVKVDESVALPHLHIHSPGCTKCLSDRERMSSEIFFFFTEKSTGPIMMLLNQSRVDSVTAPLPNVTASTPLNEDLLPLWVDITMKVLYVVVAVLGVLGNSLVFYLFGSKRVKMTPFNILLLNLSISDVLADLSIWPYVFIDLRSLRGLSQSVADSMCVITMGQMTYWLAASAALLTLCVISVSRYLFIRYPMKAQSFKKSHALYIVTLFIWPISTIVIMPHFFSFHYNNQSSICERRWPDGINGRVYSGTTALLAYILPNCILTFTFIATRQRLWLTKSSNLIQSPTSIRRRKAASMLLAALILAFFACWGPFFIYWALSRTFKSIFPEGPEGEYMRMRIIVFVVFVSLCNTVADPIIYGLRGDDFRKSLRKLKNGILHPSQQQPQRTKSHTKSTKCSGSSDHRGYGTGV